MKKLVSVLFLCAFSAGTFAGTGLNCSDLDAIGDNQDALEACVIQTNDELNATYKQLRDAHKNNKGAYDALKDMQVGWIKMRDAQCQFKSMNTGSAAAQVGVMCEIEMTVQRENELAGLL
jgi:uncharacterized protein YecT (DUF1311 family)